MKFLNLLLSVLFLVPLSAKALPLDDLFARLSTQKVNWEPTGTVCEQVALIELSKLYPADQFELLTGLSYHYKGQTMGELDLVAIRKDTKKVQMFGEVKCWASFKNGLRKAREQRQRFDLFKNRNVIITDQNGKRYHPAQFNQVKEYLSVSNKGGIDAGFDYELDNTLDELMELRKRLLLCQDQGRCPRP